MVSAYFVGILKMISALNTYYPEALSKKTVGNLKKVLYF